MQLTDFTEDELLEELERRKLRCEVKGCQLEAEYEGWYRVLDFSGNRTGLNRKGRFCEAHSKGLLIAFENKETAP